MRIGAIWTAIKAASEVEDVGAVGAGGADGCRRAIEAGSSAGEAANHSLVQVIPTPALRYAGVVLQQSTRAASCAERTAARTSSAQWGAGQTLRL